MRSKFLFSILLLSMELQSCSYKNGMASEYKLAGEVQDSIGKLSLDDSLLRQSLSAEQYNVCLLKGTERPFSGKYWDHHEKGTYHCSICGLALFSSDTKFNSGTGWPSFYDKIEDERLLIQVDSSYGMLRAEVLCARCGAHLGHSFNDGPPPTGERYCINSVSLEFKKE